MTGMSEVSVEGSKRRQSIPQPTIESEKDGVLTILRQTIDKPTLANARALESILRRAGTTAKVFGRLNQKASIEAAAESDRGITERIANAEARRKNLIGFDRQSSRGILASCHKSTFESDDD